MGTFAEKARKAAAAAKAAGGPPADGDEIKKKPKEETTGIDMEGKSRVPMPNLPKPLTIEEKKYLLAVERGDSRTVKKMLQKSARIPAYMNSNCVDPMGRGALHMAIDNENLEMVELLVVMGVETRDSLLHAIDVEFVEAVEVLLEHEEVIHKDNEPYSWEKIDRHTASFTPEITPLILAAHRDNYEILKILLDRGAALPMPHDIRCACEECIKSSSEDSLRHSMSRINSYRALASPSLIALSSTDPILTAFELSDELKSLAFEENEFSCEYMELRKQCRNFAEELLSHTRTSTELAVILNYDPESLPYEDGDNMKLKRLELAIDYKQKAFVAHPNVQQLLAALWYSGLPGFRRLPLMEKLTQLIKVVVGFPMYCVQYMLFPDSPKGKIIRSPFMKFLLHSASYLFFLMMLILFSVRFEELFVFFLGTESMRENLMESLKKQRGNGPTYIECIILLYVMGFLWEEIKEINKDGLKKYFLNMWNILDVMRDSLYLSTMFLRIVAYIQQSMEINDNPQTAYIPREEWHGFDMQLVSEGLFSAANILSALKLVHIFSINPYLGPLQISLGRMVIDIVKFFFIYSLVLFAFACGLTQLLWYYNDLEKQKCYSLPGGLPDWGKNGDACMKWRRFHNLFEASQSLFWAGFGMIGLDDFELSGVGGYTRFWSMLMFGTYSIINLIVLLNLLIAMMSNSYAFIVDHADTEWKFARSKLWMSYFEEGSTVPPPFNILPSVKSIKRFFSGDERKKLLRKLSSKTMGNAKKARDYRYLAVMRALIWRYICAKQQSSIDRAVTEDDVNEVKGDISSLRFELIDLFEHNGMDVSRCEKKSKAALGRKMKIWERRLMRDFHVSPAMGTEDDSGNVTETQAEEPSAADQFRRIARLAMITKGGSQLGTNGSQTGSNQIGRTNLTDDTNKNNLKEAMEKTRRKLEEGTPDGSPASSRGCSPYPELYTGPHLMETIQSLELKTPTPSATPVSNTPGPKTQWNFQKGKTDAQAKDLTKLTIPGRRSESSLKPSDAPNNDKEIPIPKSIQVCIPPPDDIHDRLEKDGRQEKLFDSKPNLTHMVDSGRSVVENTGIGSIASKFSNTPASNILEKSAMKIAPPHQAPSRRPRAPHQPYTAVSDLETMDMVRKPKLSVRQFSQDKLDETTVSQENLNAPILKPQVVSPASQLHTNIKPVIPSCTPKEPAKTNSMSPTEKTSRFDVIKPKENVTPAIEVIPSTPAPPETPVKVPKESENKHLKQDPIKTVIQKPSSEKAEGNKTEGDGPAKVHSSASPTETGIKLTTPSEPGKIAQSPSSDGHEAKTAKKQPAPAAPSLAAPEPPKEKALPTGRPDPQTPPCVSPVTGKAGWI